MVQNIVNASKADSSKLFLTGSGNFREEVATLLKYKGNREDTPKPEHYKALREYAIDHLGAELIEGMEADDALAIEQQADINGTIICTIDKDLNQVHGMKFNWTKRDKPSGDTSECFNYIEKEEGMILFFTQLITGDATDNIGGLKGTRGKPGPGMRGAAKAYKDCKKVSEYYEAALEMYKKKYGDTLTYTSWKGTELTKTTEEVMLENASLLWMKRTKDEGELNLSLMEKYYE
jgi:5'-3' exonuclease